MELHGLDVVMEYLPPLPEQTWNKWQSLGPHPTLLRPKRGGIQYAALDWRCSRAPLEHVVRWGWELADLYQMLRDATVEMAWLGCPLVKIDLEGRLRVGFSKPDLARLPKETADQWPLMDDRALVHVVATAMVDLATEIDWRSRLGRVLARALDADPDWRHATLAQLQDILRFAGGTEQAPPRRERWDQVERGLGYLAVDRPDLALPCFRAAHARDRSSPELAELVALSKPRIDHPGSVSGTISNEHVIPQPWVDARSAGHARERARDFRGALALYEPSGLETEAEVIEHALARARCNLELGFADKAIVLVRGVLAHDAASREARMIETRALLAVQRHADALIAADAWLALADDGAVHHARGKALLGLRRLVDARDAFERACVRAPDLVAAQLLRGAVDKALNTIRIATGTPGPMAIDLPPGPVRDALLAGRIDAAIALLEPSQLQAELLSYAGRFDEALGVFATLEGDAALAGRARALIDLGRTDEALAILGTLDADGFIAIPSAR